jgi:RMKL-like, methyltransferase domain
MRRSLAKVIPKLSNSEIFSDKIYDHLFPAHLELVPQLNEVYELELAFYESRILRDEEIIRNGAYFAKVGDTLTRHFLICSGEPVRLPQHSSSRLRSFFKTNQFKTGYGTHGLFPYRGKFHPQMIKGLINIMGLKPGDTVLDPMMGSGTVLIEACLMGINSVGIDASPFCRFKKGSSLLLAHFGRATPRMRRPTGTASFASLTTSLRGLNFLVRRPAFVDWLSSLPALKCYSWQPGKAAPRLPDIPRNSARPTCRE